MRYIIETLHNGATAAATGPWVDVRGDDFVAFDFVDVGSPNGTVDFEGSTAEDGSNPFDVMCYQHGSIDPANGTLQATTPGYYLLHPRHACHFVRANLTLRNSGAFTIRIARRRLGL